MTRNAAAGRTRSAQLAVALAAASLAGCCVNHSEGPPPPASARVAAFLDTLEERTFHYFWDLTNTQNGLTPDRAPSPSFSSIAAVGFALTAYPIGVERNYITRAQAAQRALTTLRFFWTAPQDSPLRLDRLSWVLLSLPGHEHGAPLPKRGALDHRYIPPARGDPAVPVVLRRDRSGRNRDPRARGLHLLPRGLELGAGAAARRQHGLAPGGRIHPDRLDRLQRGDDPLCPRPRLAHARRRRHRLEQVGERLSMGDVPRPVLRAVRAAVRPRVLARLDRFPGDPGLVHAGPWHPLLRELAPRDLRAPRLRRGQSDGMDRLLDPDVGAHGLGWPGQHDAAAQRKHAPVSYLLGARGLAVRVERRRDTRPHGRRRRCGIHARNRHPRTARDARDIRVAPVLDLRFPRRVQPDLHCHRRPGGARHGGPHPGLVRRRLPGHRSGADPCDDRELSHGTDLAADARQSPHRAGAMSSGVHGGMASGKVSALKMRAAKSRE